MSRDLLATQNLFWQLITAPEGVEKALEELGITIEELEATFNSDNGFPARERVDVYANMYFYRILDVLKDDFTRVLQWVGDAQFHNLVTDYLLVHPSENPSLRWVGRHLPEFLRTHALREAFPAVADLALLEWTRGLVFDAPDFTSVAATDLQQIPPTAWAGLRLELSPALRLVELEWPAHRVWRALKDGLDVPALKETPTSIRAWRDGNLIYHAPMKELEHEALLKFEGGLTLAETCVELQELEGDKPIAARIAELLHKWIEEGLIASATAAEDGPEGT